ncbi:hypothetical protein [Paracoccus aminovorans]|uniref:hypothetical protein n=1 Tax=Paracoccus aminovorans TaxID=34004 RepID=UPI002B2572DF|nr:hypothetical protein [Paracoccus aminovorans]
MAQVFVAACQIVREHSPSSLGAAIDLCNDALHLCKISDVLDRSSLFADIKVLLCDLAQFTIKVGEVVVAIGRRMVSIAMWLARTIPGTALGVAVALTLSALIGGVPLIGSLLALALQKLLLLIGMTAGAMEDIRNHAMKDAMDRVARQFSALNGAVAA